MSYSYASSETNGEKIPLTAFDTTQQISLEIQNRSSQPREGERIDVVCISHLRWDFVFQRPQHLMARFGKEGKVYFFEEPVFEQTVGAWLDVSERDNFPGITILVAHLPQGLEEGQITDLQAQLLENYLLDNGVSKPVLWLYSPMALLLLDSFSKPLQAAATVYDCMDELSAFDGAPLRLRELEQLLFTRADIVFTGGMRLYEAKKGQHSNVYGMPSSIDTHHFGKAKTGNLEEPEDMAEIARPRVGFYGVVDERFDIELLGGAAALDRSIQYVIVGPVVKIDPATLPQADNIHYLGGKTYEQLPAYLAGWDVAALLFARNASTEFISPTKTPEYLAGGKPVVSTSIHDVIHPYADLDLLDIADEPEAFVAAIFRAMERAKDTDWQTRTDAYLATLSWDKTHSVMREKIKACVIVK
jgi:hypothetical protein